jgi:hypothetical protein
VSLAATTPEEKDMKIRRIAPPLQSLAALCLGLALATAPAQAQKRGIELNIGPEYRQVKTSYYKYNRGNPYNTWETQKLTGLKSEMILRVLKKEKIGLEGGIGLGLYSVGAYDYEVRSYTGTGPSGGFAFSIDGVLQGSYALSSQVSLLARVGGGYLQLDASGDVPRPVPFDDDFAEGVPDIYVGGGLQCAFSPRMVGLVVARVAVADLGSWTDYSETLNSMSGFGVSALLGFRL